MINYIVAFFSPIIFGVFFNLGPKRFFLSGISGIFAFVGYLIGQIITTSPIFATFLGALFVGLSSEVFARNFKYPSLVTSLPGSIPLVPGLAAYRTADNYINDNYYEAAKNLSITLGSAGAIAIGLMLGTAIVRNIYQNKTVQKLRNRKSLNSQIKRLNKEFHNLNQ